MGSGKQPYYTLGADVCGINSSETQHIYITGAIHITMCSKHCPLDILLCEGMSLNQVLQK